MHYIIIQNVIIIKAKNSYKERNLGELITDNNKMTKLPIITRVENLRVANAFSFREVLAVLIPYYD